MQEPRVIVALDYDNKETALSFVAQLDPSLCKLKVGKEMFTLFGPEFVKTLVSKGLMFFLILNFTIYQIRSQKRVKRLQNWVYGW